MLGFAARFILGIGAGVACLGLLIARAWGWSEYASPDLYLIYYQLANPSVHYFVVNADGSDSGDLLRWDGSPITKLDCSPDGRRFAFLTNDGQLIALDRGGIVSQQPVAPSYSTVNVADDGSLALYDPASGKLWVNDTEIDLSTPDRPGHPFDRIDIASHSEILWTQNFSDIALVSLATGVVTPAVPHGYSGQWLASGQMIVFADQVTDSEGIGLYGGQYLIDLPSQRVIRIGDWTLSSPISPDGTKVAAASPITSLNHVAQAVVYGLFDNSYHQLLTHDPKTASQPVCFLTFRPELNRASS